MTNKEIVEESIQKAEEVVRQAEFSEITSPADNRILESLNLLIKAVRALANEEFR